MAIARVSVSNLEPLYGKVPESPIEILEPRVARFCAGFIQVQINRLLQAPREHY